MVKLLNLSVPKAVSVACIFLLQVASGVPARPVKPLGRAIRKVRMFWVRHGQSCSNVLDRCNALPPKASKLLPDLERALREYPAKNFKAASLDRNFGVKPATDAEPDCTIRVLGGGLVPGHTGEDGAVIRAHDLYWDPTLTDCARKQSELAGRSFLRWLRRSSIRLDFVGSSFLMRAFDTAYSMFVAPCVGQNAENCTGILRLQTRVTPVPYFTERAPKGITSIQADNMPRPAKQQAEQLGKSYQRQLEIDASYTETWPRSAQQFEKFKAFLAVQVLPPLLKGPIAERLEFLRLPANVDTFRAAMETALPESMHYADRRNKTTSFDWQGGSYETGAGFTQEEYESLDAPEVNIAIVGHNRMMIEYCADGLPPKPRNNAVFEKLFVLETDTAAEGSSSKSDEDSVRFVLRELLGRCRSVMDAPDGKDSMDALVVEDVLSCVGPFPAFLGLLDIPTNGNDKKTQCVQLAEREGAYPIHADFEPGIETKHSSKEL